MEGAGKPWVRDAPPSPPCRAGLLGAWTRPSPYPNHSPAVGPHPKGGSSFQVPTSMETEAGTQVKEQGLSALGLGAQPCISGRLPLARGPFVKGRGCWHHHWGPFGASCLGWREPYHPSESTAVHAVSQLYMCSHSLLEYFPQDPGPGQELGCRSWGLWQKRYNPSSQLGHPGNHCTFFPLLFQAAQTRRASHPQKSLT